MYMASREYWRSIWNREPPALLNRLNPYKLKKSAEWKAATERKSMKKGNNIYAYSGVLSHMVSYDHEIFDLVWISIATYIFMF